VLARRGPNVERDVHHEFSERGSRDFPGESKADAYRGGSAALGLAIEFLQEDAQVPHFAFLPYRYLLVVLTRFFAHHPTPEPRTRQLLRRFYWRAALVGPRLARGAFVQVARQLNGCIVVDDADASVQALLEAVSSKPDDFAQPSEFRAAQAEVRFLLCAAWSLEPRSFMTGKPYTRADLTEALALGDTNRRATATPALALVVPRGRPDTRTRVGNRVFLLADDDEERARLALTERPEGLDEAHWRALLTSHAVDPNALLGADEGVFLSAREERLKAVTRDFLERMTERHFEDTPRLESFDLDGGDPSDDDGPALEPDGDAFA
jgi:hypothetical protein